MSGALEFDFSDFDRLAVDLGEVEDDYGKNAAKAMVVASRNVKDDWRDSARGLPHAPSFPASITYDIKTFRGFGSSVIQGEIGPDKERAQGALGNLIEYGSVNNAPMGLGHGALQREEEDFVKGITNASADAEKKNHL